MFVRADWPCIFKHVFEVCLEEQIDHMIYFLTWSKSHFYEMFPNHDEIMCVRACAGVCGRVRACAGVCGRVLGIGGIPNYLTL